MRVKQGLPVHKGAGVYGVTNVKNGKVYVGSSLAVRGRLLAHRSYLRRGVHDNTYLQRAWAKYGEGAFRFDVLEKCRPKDSVRREQAWMKKLNSCDRRYGYNICLFAGAGAMKGRKHTDESRRKMSENRKGKGDWRPGVEAAARSTRGRKRTPKERAAISAKLKGRVFTEEHRAAISRTHWTKNSDNVEALNRMKTKLTGRKLSAEHRQRISEGGVRGWQEYRSRMQATTA